MTSKRTTPFDHNCDAIPWPWRTLTINAVVMLAAAGTLVATDSIGYSGHGWGDLIFTYVGVAYICVAGPFVVWWFGCFICYALTGCAPYGTRCRKRRP